MRTTKTRPTATRHRQPRMLRIAFQRVPREVDHLRTQIAFAAIRRLYCELVPLWQGCTRGYCRRHKRCTGEARASLARACLARAWPLLPVAVQNHIYAEVVRGGPRRVPAMTDKEQSLRHFPPSNFTR